MRVATDWADWGNDVIGGEGERNHPRGPKPKKQVTGDPQSCRQALEKSVLALGLPVRNFFTLPTPRHN